MHERSSKNKPLDTILYEIDMVRHCANTLAEKKARAQEIGSTHNRAEYYLGIEGFLLHMRNLLGFFMNRREKETDLIIKASSQWAGRLIEPREYSDIVKQAKRIGKKYGADESGCYDQISKFLQHCTTHRHERARQWDIEGMFAELDKLLDEFERRFAPTSRKPIAKRSVELIGPTENSTATLRTFSPIFVKPSDEKNS